MTVMELEDRKPERTAILGIRLRKGEVVRADGVVLDWKGKTTNMRLVWTADGRAWARWMPTGMLEGDLIVEGWKYRRMAKYDLISN